MAGHSSRGTVIRAFSGNAFIAVMKLAAWLVSGSGAMLSEAIHSFADVANQGLLLVGLRHAERGPDKRHQYGYGLAAFFWALVSAMGIFFIGCGVTVYHGVHQLLHPPEILVTGWLTWTVLATSFAIEGWVLVGALRHVYRDKPANVGLLAHLPKLKDPMMVAVLLEDFAACIGVILAIIGIGLTWLTGDPIWDAIASILIGLLLGVVALVLVRMNQRYLLGHAIDPETEAGIRAILLTRPSIEAAVLVQSRWVGPATFVYKAEVDFDGAWFAAQLEPYYAAIFESTDDHEQMRSLLATYTEHVSRLVAREVDVIEELIRASYPEALFIMLEPHAWVSEPV